MSSGADSEVASQGAGSPSPVLSFTTKVPGTNTMISNLNSIPNSPANTAKEKSGEYLFKTWLVWERMSLIIYFSLVDLLDRTFICHWLFVLTLDSIPTVVHVIIICLLFHYRFPLVYTPYSNTKMFGETFGWGIWIKGSLRQLSWWVSSTHPGLVTNRYLGPVTL